MFQNGDAYSYETSSYAGSVMSNGFSETSSLMSSMSRPSGRSIYLQRKEYVENINKQMGRFQYKVEHLFTCDVEGPDMRLDDCVERLKMLEAMGSIWGQDMILQARNGCLQLIDIETNEELESHPTGSVLGVEAMLDTCVYNSLLTVAVREEGKATVSVFMFQSDSLRADHIKRDLDRALMHRIDDRGDLRPPRDNMRAILAAKMGTAQPDRPPSEDWDRPEPSPMEWDAPDYDESPVPTPTPAPPPQARQQPVPVPRQPSPPPPPSPERTPTPQPYTEKDRNVDILNHLISDIEAFMGRVSAVAAKKSKKKLWKSKKKKNKPKVIEGMPSAAEFEICLQKIKFGFNLLAVLDGQISEPSSQDLVHVFFSILTFLVEYCPEELPPAIVAPLFTPHCIRLLSEEATVEEDQFWQTLGDAWNIPSTQWGDDDEDIPEYTPLFDDGWEPRDADPEIQPPSRPPSRQPSKSPASKPAAQPASKPAAQPASKPASKPPNQAINRQPSQHSRKEAPAPQSTWKPPAEEEDVEDDPASFMRVIFDFTARNPRELSISKGEVVQLLDMSKQWWKVRNNDGEEGFVPNNVVEPLDKKEEDHQQVVANPTLTRKSKPAEVRAWLEFKGFNKITVKCLGMLSGPSLLGMTREELKMVCPDEGGRVFFQLQNVKSANALASEVRHLE